MVDERSVAPVPEQTEDFLLYRLLVGGLVAMGLVVIVGGLVLAGLGKAIPEGLIAIGSAAVGGLVGLLVPSPVK